MLDVAADVGVARSGGRGGSPAPPMLVVLL